MKLPEKFFFLLNIIFTILLFSCQSSEEKLVVKFKQEFKNDSLKFNHAIYLLKDISERSHFVGEEYDSLTNLILKHNINEDSLQRIVYSLNFKQKNDTKETEANYLIGNIRKTYNSVQSAFWAKDYKDSFIQKYILPYRFNSANLENWRDSVFKDFGDTVFQYKNVEDATLYLVNSVTERMNNFHLKSGMSLPDLTYSSLRELSYGSCKELCEYMQYICSAYAIPCVHDFTPLYANLSSGHHWNAIIDEKGNTIPFVVPAQVDTLRRFKSDHYKLAKVYRIGFEINKNSYSSLYGNKNYLPDYLNNKYISDVTADYIRVKDVTLSIGKKSYADSIVYLSVFNNMTWYPVSWGNIIHDKNKNACLFKDIGVGNIYMPTSIDTYGTTSLSFPFLLDENGKINYLEPRRDSLITLCLTRKYPLTERIKEFINRMNGGYFELSNDSLFKKSNIIYKISGVNSELIQKQQVDLQKSYKYIRYMSPPGSFCNVAELHFFDENDNEIKGKIITNRQTHPSFRDRVKENAFDGDVLTFFHADRADYSWVGMEFDSPQKIKEIEFLPRNGNNVIEPHNLYEVFYWDDRWISLGQQLASSNTIIYKGVPSNALYYIRNLTKGKQERIFIYKEGEQIWY